MSEAARGGRHAGRRRALEILYAADVVRRELAGELARVDADPGADPMDRFTRALVAGVADDLAAIDAAIATHARGWAIGRMPAIDRNLLRLGVHELRSGLTPPAVVIDEAVELAKELSTDASPGYVNGVLAAVARALSAHEGADGPPGAAAGAALRSGGEHAPAAADETS